VSVRAIFIEPGSPGENGYVESFNSKMRDEVLAREIFYSVKEAPVLIEMWCKDYNTIRP
jgi:putative transposase